MLNDKQVKEKFYHCFSDLQRSATSYYFNPQGKNHLVFLKHAKKILRSIGNKKAHLFTSKITKIEKEITSRPKLEREKVNLADKILTLGCLIK